MTLTVVNESNRLVSTITPGPEGVQSVAVGTLPLRVSFDGANIWVNNGTQQQRFKTEELNLLIRNKEPPMKRLLAIVVLMLVITCLAFGQQQTAPPPKPGPDQLSCSSQMTDNWKPYLCNVNGAL